MKKPLGVFIEMLRKKLPKSIRKFIRREKARLRGQVLDARQKEELISELYKKYDNTTNLQPSHSERN